MGTFLDDEDGRQVTAEQARDLALQWRYVWAGLVAGLKDNPVGGFWSFSGGVAGLIAFSLDPDPSYAPQVSVFGDHCGGP